MAIISFDVAAFRRLFPAFSGSCYSDSTLQVFWDMATAYLNDRTGGCGNMNLKQQTLALNLMTAHLAAITAMIAAKDTPGIVTSATIDKISVTIQPPPEVNQWQYWLNSTPYGQQLLALLQIAAAGGRFYNPVSVFTAFRH